jgi:hypothetical protein
MVDFDQAIYGKVEKLKMALYSKRKKLEAY